MLILSYVLRKLKKSDWDGKLTDTVLTERNRGEHDEFRV